MKNKIQECPHLISVKMPRSFIVMLTWDNIILSSLIRVGKGRDDSSGYYGKGA